MRKRIAILRLTPIPYFPRSDTQCFGKELKATALPILIDTLFLI